MSICLSAIKRLPRKCYSTIVIMQTPVMWKSRDSYTLQHPHHMLYIYPLLRVLEELVFWY